MRRRTITAWVALAGVLAAAGCWPQPGRGPEHQAWNPAEATLTAANVATLQPAWSVDVGRWAAEPVV
ncbi:MAG TPA: hypothetical protein VF743_12710, partial [Acidimicrobiales bacterium]